MILLTADLLELKADPELPAQGVIARGAQGDRARHRSPPCWSRTAPCRSATSSSAVPTWGRVRAMSDDVGTRNPRAPDRPRRSRSPASTSADRRRHRSRWSTTRPRRGRSSSSASSSSASATSARRRAAVARAALPRDPRRRGQGAAGRAQGRRQGSVEVLRDSDRASCRPTRSRSRSCTAAWARSRPTTSCSPRRPRRSSSASTSGPERNATDLAEKEQVDIRLLHRHLRAARRAASKAMIGLLDADLQEVSKGRAEVRDIFKRAEGRDDRRLPRGRRLDPAHRHGPAGARRPRHPRGQDRLAQALQGRRLGGACRVRLRHRSRALPGRQAGRRDRGLRARRRSRRPC